MGLFEDLLEKKEKLSLVGLGYVGMPIAVAFAKKLSVVGYDLNSEKIALYRAGKDPTKEVGDEVIAQTAVDFTDDESRLRMLVDVVAKLFQGARLVGFVEPNAFLDGRLRTHDEACFGREKRRRELDVVLYDLVVGATVELLVPRVAILLNHNHFRVFTLVFIMLVNARADEDGQQNHRQFNTYVY